MTMAPPPVTTNTTTLTSEAELQERLEAYKRKLQKRKEAQAIKDAEKEERKKSRLQRRESRSKTLNDRFAQEQAEAKAKMEEHRQKRLEKRRQNKPRRKFQRSVSKAMKKEHGVLADTEVLIHQVEQAMEERFEEFERKLQEQKNKQVEEMVQEQERKEAMQRKREQEAEEDRRKTEEALAALREQAQLPETNLVRARSYTKYNKDQKPIWATPSFQQNKQERRMQAFYKMQQERKKQEELRKKQLHEEEWNERQLALQKARMKAVKELEARRLATLYKEEEDIANEQVRLLLSEEEQTKNASAKQVIVSKRLEWQEKAALAAERRAEQEQLAQFAEEERKKEEYELEKSLDQMRASKELEIEQLERLRQKEDLKAAQEEATARELARQKAHKKQKEAIAAAKAIKKGSEPDSDEDSSDEEDEKDWKVEEKQKFLAQAKQEVNKQKETKKKRALARTRSKETKAAHKAKLGNANAIFRLSDLDDEYSDEETEEVVNDLRRIQEAVAALQSRLEEVKVRESNQLKTIQEEVKKRKLEIRDKERKGLVRYTQEEHDDMDRRVRETKEVIETLRNQNRKIREQNMAMVLERCNLRKRNKTLKESIKYNKKVLMRGANMDKGRNTGMNEHLEQKQVLWRKACEQVEEMIEMRTLQTASLKRRKELREACMSKIVGHFQATCPNDVLALKLGAMSMGEDDDEVNRIVGDVRLVLSKPAVDSDTEDESGSDSEEERVPVSEFNQYV